MNDEKKTGDDSDFVSAIKQAMLRDENCEWFVGQVRIEGTVMPCLYVTLPTNIAAPLTMISHALGKKIEQAEGRQSFQQGTTEWVIPVSNIQNAPALNQQATEVRFGASSFVGAPSRSLS